MRLKPSLYTVLAALVAASLWGCESKSELSDVSDRDMRAKMKECKTMKSPAPAMIFACENYQRECEKRADNAGHFVC
jgi:hypothetical protein